MKNFKQFLKSKKTIVYHVSPDSSIGILRATGSHKGQQSVKMKEGGIYVAPKFRDAVAWAVSYIGGKKYYTQKPNERLKNKEEVGGWHGENGPRVYKNLTIYEIEVPKELLRNVWSSAGWEPEYFIPTKYIDQLKIIKSKTYSLDDLIVLNNRETNKRSELHTISDSIRIRKASKTNLAARYYLELTDLYNQHLLGGKNPIINDDPVFGSKNDHLIHQKIEKLKDYIYNSEDGWHSIKIIEKLDKKQKVEVEKLYNEIKLMIERL